MNQPKQKCRGLLTKKIVQGSPPKISVDEKVKKHPPRHLAEVKISRDMRTRELGEIRLLLRDQSADTFSLQQSCPAGHAGILSATTIAIDAFP